MDTLATVQRRFSESLRGAAAGEGGVAVYQFAYRVRLQMALADDFPRVKKVLGDEEFFRLAASCVDAHPSTFSSLNEYGQVFAPYLVHHLPASAAELARFEWLEVRASIAQVLSPARMEALGRRFSQAEEFLLRLAPSAQLFAGAAPVGQFLENEPSAGENYLIYAQNLQVHWERVTEDGRWRLLQRLGEGLSFVQLAEELEQFEISPLAAQNIFCDLSQKCLLDFSDAP